MSVPPKTPGKGAAQGAGDNANDWIELGGERLRVFSRAHLEAQNPYAALSDNRLIKAFDDYLDRVGEASPMIMVAMRRALKEGTMRDGKDISNLVTRVAIQEGHMYGLGSSPQVSSEAYLLWAGAARLMERAGYAPDEPVRRKGQQGAANDKGGAPPATPPRGMRPGG